MAKRTAKKNDNIAQYERRIYDLEQLIDIARSFNSAIDTNTLLESIAFSCMAQLHVADAGIFILDPLNSDNFILKRKQNMFDPSNDKDYQIAYTDSVVSFLTENKNTVSMETLRKNCTDSDAIKIFEELNPTLIVPLLQKNHLGGILFLGERFYFDAETGADYTEYEKDLILSIASLAAIAINNATLIERSSTDMMTQLKLKYFFFNILSEKLDNALQEKKPLSVIMFDIDFFKHFNDTYGHECGDYVLKQVASLIKQNLREEDLASRYGGEEFTVMLNETPKDAAVSVAERIRSCIENHDFVYNEEHMHVTISCGVSVFDHETNPITIPQQLVNQADQGLYISKHNGRNRVTYAPPSLVALEGGEENDAKSSAEPV